MTRSRGRLGPILLFLGLAALSVLLWRDQIANRSRLLNSYTATVADQASIRLLSYMQTRLIAMQVFSRGLAEQKCGRGEDLDFAFLASVIYAAQPGYQAINWVDSTGVVSIVVPEATNQGVKGLDLHHHPVRYVRDTLERALRDTTVVLTPCFKLITEGEGLVSWWPVVAHERLYGLISGVFRVSDLIRAALSEGILNDFHLLVREEGRVIFEDEPGKSSDTSARSTLRQVRIPHGRTWDLILTPRSGLEARFGAARTGVFLVFALALSLVLAGMAHAIIHRSDEFRAARDAAVREIALRQQAEREKERTIEDLALANRKLEQANQELDAYIYAASHDVRAPLVAVAGLVDILLEPEGALDAGERQHVTARIRHNIQKLDTLVQDMLMVSRSRRLERTSAPIDIRAVCGEAWNTLKDLVGDRPMDFSCGVSPGLAFRSDPLRFRQIVNNLLSNAVKYRDPAKPLLRVRVEACLASEPPGRGRLTMVVRDNGIGIPAECVPRIFDMFYKASDDAFGSGLGLYIVKQHCVALGGDVSYAPHADGSEFTVVLPADPEA